MDHRNAPQTRLEPIGRRLKRAVDRLRGGGAPAGQRIYRVDLGGRFVKRVVFDDPLRAASIARSLRAFAGRDVYPELIEHDGCELWVEFVEGEPVDSLDAALIADLARLFSTLYGHDARRVRLSDGPWASQLAEDLAFLRESGVLDERLHLELEERAVSWAPEHVWLGYDYGDARRSNLIRCADGRHRFIDIESALHDQLLGMGAAKACLRWLGPQRAAFFAHESWRTAPAPDSSPRALDISFNWVELACLARWTRRSVELRKRKLVRPALFQALAERALEPTPTIAPTALGSE